MEKTGGMIGIFIATTHDQVEALKLLAEQAPVTWVHWYHSPIERPSAGDLLQLVDDTRRALHRQFNPPQARGRPRRKVQ